MKKITNGLFVFLLLAVSIANAQPPADPGLWSNVTNPTGDQVVPAVWADARTGVLSLHSLGLNFNVDTTSPSFIEADDVGIISIMAEGPVAAERLFDGEWTNPTIGGTIQWTATHFNGREQVFGVSADAEFLEPGVYEEVYRYDPPLKVCDVGEIEIGVNFGAGQPGDILRGSYFTVLSGPLSCNVMPFLDFNDDYVFDCQDVDELVAQIASGSTNSEFDLNGDGSVDTTDLSEWLFQAGEYNGFELGYFPGDANLDGVVDVPDFNTWNANKFTETTGWCSGDFNADGVVDTSDFNIWNANKFTSSAAPAAVPEPDSLLWLLPFAFLPIAIRRLN